MLHGNEHAHFETVYDPDEKVVGEIPSTGEDSNTGVLGDDEFIQSLPMTEFIAPGDEVQALHLFGPGSIAFSLISRLSEIRSRIRSKHQTRKIVAVLVVLLLLPLSFMAVMDYAGTVVDRSEVDIISVRILGSDTDSLTMELDLNITNPSSFSSTLEPSRLNLNYPDEKVATLILPSMRLEPGSNSLTLKAVLRENELDSMQDLANDILSSKDIRISITGTVKLDALISLEFPVNKVITFDSFDPPGVEIRSIEFDSDQGEILTGTVEVVVTNPSKLETILNGLHFDVLNNGSMLASITTSGYLGYGTNEMSLTFTIPDHGLDTARELTTHIMGGGTPDLEIRGNGSLVEGMENEYPNGSGNGNSGDNEGGALGKAGGTYDMLLSGSLLSKLATGFTHQFMDNDSRLGSIDDLEIEVGSVSIHATDELGLHGSVLANITNPSILTIPLGTVELGLLYNGSTLAELSLSSPDSNSLILVPGSNTILLSLFIPANASDAYNTLANDMLEGGIFDFTLFGIEDGSDPMSYLMGAFQYIYHMNISDCVSTKAHSLRVSLGLFNTDIDLIAEIDNPSPITMNLEDFEFIAYYEGNYLSHIDLHDPVIVPGYQTVGLDMSVSTISLQSLGLMIKLLTGSEIIIVIEASHDFAPGHVFSFTVTTTIGDTVPDVQEVLPFPDPIGVVTSPLSVISNIVPEKVNNPF